MSQLLIPQTPIEVVPTSAKVIRPWRYDLEARLCAGRSRETRSRFCCGHQNRKMLKVVNTCNSCNGKSLNSCNNYYFVRFLVIFAAQMLRSSCMVFKMCLAIIGGRAVNLPNVPTVWAGLQRVWRTNQDYAYNF